MKPDKNFSCILSTINSEAGTTVYPPEVYSCLSHPAFLLYSIIDLFQYIYGSGTLAPQPAPETDCIQNGGAFIENQ